MRKTQRILWLLNHRTLIKVEPTILVKLGYEIYTPKKLPLSRPLKSSIITSDFDSFQGISETDLFILNNFNFYDQSWSTEISEIVNRNFDAVFVAPGYIDFQEVINHFYGQIFFRVFGLENGQSYEKVLVSLYGEKILWQISEIQERFYFAEAYPNLHEIEPQVLSRNSIFLPIAMPKNIDLPQNIPLKNVIGLLCPNIATDSYYNHIYTEFIKNRDPNLPYIILGTQEQPVDDPNCIGFLEDYELAKTVSSLSAFFYPSREKRHLHYFPVEMISSGVPVVYFKDSLLSTFCSDTDPGAVNSYPEANNVLGQISGGNEKLRNQIIELQRGVPNSFFSSNCISIWSKHFRMGLIDTSYKRNSRNPRINRQSISIKALAAEISKNQFIPDRMKIEPFEIDFSKNSFPWILKNSKGIFDETSPEGRWASTNVEIEYFFDLPDKFILNIELLIPAQNPQFKLKVSTGENHESFHCNNLYGSIFQIKTTLFPTNQSNKIYIESSSFFIGENDTRKLSYVIKKISLEDI